MYLNSLGNLLLLSRKKNSTLQNFDFERKKCLKNKDGKDIGYYNGSYSEIEVSKQTEWTPEQIKERGLVDVAVYGRPLEIQVLRLGY